MLEIKAPFAGKLVSITDTPDPVFSEKMAGDGVAIILDDDKAVAPFNGIITKIFKTNHAFIISDPKSDTDLIVHIGIDTVKHAEHVFKKIANEGDIVKTGDLIIKIDLSELKKIKKCSLYSPIIVDPELTKINEITDLNKQIKISDLIMITN